MIPIITMINNQIKVVKIIKIKIETMSYNLYMSMIHHKFL